jgi:hypothetical protein
LLDLFAGARRGLDRAVYRSWRDSLAELTEAGGDPGQVLGWGRTADEDYCIVAVGLLSIGSAGGWRHIGWHQIERGGFDADSQTLRWTLYDADQDSVTLTEPGRVPPLFRERVAASITVEQFVPMEPDSQTRGVIISGRRDLSRPDGPIHWRASLPKAMTWQTPGIADFADSAIARLQGEYDPGN